MALYIEDFSVSQKILEYFLIFPIILLFILISFLHPVWWLLEAGIHYLPPKPPPQIVSHLLQYHFPEELILSWLIWEVRHTKILNLRYVCHCFYFLSIAFYWSIYFHSSVILFFTFCFYHYYFCNISNT